MTAPLSSRLFVALDTADAAAATAQARVFHGLSRVGIKLGLEFFAANGPSGVGPVAEAADLFLDLKLHDIPNTVTGAVRAVVPLRPALLTLHAAGGAAMLRAAVEAAATAAEALGLPRPRLVGVTVLTSLSDEDLATLGFRGSSAEQGRRLADLAQGCGLDGVVCSPHEIAILRRQCGAAFLLVTPGIRPSGVAAGDQKRVMSAGEAARLGADVLVVGRPITGAPDPAGAARQMLEEMDRAGG